MLLKIFMSQILCIVDYSIVNFSYLISRVVEILVNW